MPEEGPVMILAKVRDPRLVTIRRGGTLTDSDHHPLALWAASCAEHVLDLFESARPEDPRSRQAISLSPGKIGTSQLGAGLSVKRRRSRAD
jgi:hypothetical protein